MNNQGPQLCAFQWEPVAGSSFDLFLATTGYETRAPYAAQHLRPTTQTKWAPAFADRHIYAYEANYEYFTANGFVVDVFTSDSDFKISFHNQLMNTGSEIEVSLLVDISSMTRSRLATIIECLCEIGKDRLIKAHFCYSFGKFRLPKDDSVIRHLQPLTSLNGMIGAPELPISLYLGIGYEFERALGIYERFEPESCIAFYATGGDPGFEERTLKRNRVLIESLKPYNLIAYNLRDPYGAFVSLMASLNAEVPKSRVVIVPLGPKVFALVSLVASASIGHSVSVWRVSLGASAKPQDEHPSGVISGFGLIIKPSDA